MTAILINVGRDLAGALADHWLAAGIVVLVVSGLYVSGRRIERREAAERR